MGDPLRGRGASEAPSPLTTLLPGRSGEVLPPVPTRFPPPTPGSSEAAAAKSLAGSAGERAGLRGASRSCSRRPRRRFFSSSLSPSFSGPSARSAASLLALRPAGGTPVPPSGGHVWGWRRPQHSHVQGFGSVSLRACWWLRRPPQQRRLTLPSPLWRPSPVKKGGGGPR